MATISTSGIGDTRPSGEPVTHVRCSGPMEPNPKIAPRTGRRASGNLDIDCLLSDEGRSVRLGGAEPPEENSGAARRSPTSEAENADWPADCTRTRSWDTRFPVSRSDTGGPA